jgi:hypothetical protein
MSDAITPALTPDEWGAALCRGDFAYFADTEDVSQHGKAALCLYGPPFGFTHEDVELLRSIARDRVLRVAMEGPQPDEQLRLLADRIAALLPPPTLPPGVQERRFLSPSEVEAKFGLDADDCE